MIVAGNILNIIAPVVQIFTFALKKKEYVLAGVIVASLIWIIAYLMLGIMTAVIFTIFGVFLPVVSHFYSKRGQYVPFWMLALCSVSVIAVAAILYNGVIGLLPSLACLLLIVSFVPKRILCFRLLLLCMSLTWLVYGVLIFQFGIVVGNSLQIISLLIAMSLHDLRKKKTR